MIVVADTSPINYLVLIGHVEILPYFYGRILIPPTVWEELQDANTPDQVRTWIDQPPGWLENGLCRMRLMRLSIFLIEENAKRLPSLNSLEQIV